LERCGLRAKLLPELAPAPPRLSGPLELRFAALAWNLDERQVQALCERLRVPGEPRELALAACRNRERLRAAPAAPAAALLELLKRTDAFRRPERFVQLLQLARGFAVDTARVERAVRAAGAVDAGALAAGAAPAEIAKRIDEARIAAIARVA